MNDLTENELRILESIRSLVRFEVLKIKRKKDGKIICILKSNVKKTYDL